MPISASEHIERRLRSRRSKGRWWLGLAAIGQLLCACAGGGVCTHDIVTGAQRCDGSSGGYPEAVGTAAVAAGAWAAVGCTVNGCEPPFRCNGKTKMCERIACGEGQGSCPPAYKCDPDDKLCK